MNRLKWQAFTLAMLIIAGAVYFLKRDASTDQTNSQAHLRRHAPADSDASPELLCRTWRWAHTLDNYRGGTAMMPQKNSERLLTFAHDGTYEDVDTYQTKTGIWRLDADEDILALVSGHRAKEEYIRETDYRFEVRTLTSDSLVLAWKGRHGYVQDLYLAADEASGAAGDMPGEE